MLPSSSPSPLLSALSPVPTASGGAAPAGGDVAPGFAELLDGLEKPAGIAAVGKAVPPTAAEVVTAAEVEAPAPGEPRSERMPQPATDAEALAVQRNKAQIAATGPATAEAAIESGKILPGFLPEAADTHGQADDGTEPAANQPEIIAVLPESILTAGEAASVAPLAASSFQATSTRQTPADGREPARGSTASRRAIAAGQPAAAHPVDPASGKQPTPEVATAEHRAPAALAITVAAPAPEHGSDAIDTAPARAKPARAADLLRAEAPLMQGTAPPPTVLSSAPADQAPSANGPVASMSVPVPTPTDIDAALDHLMAAREALMPAEAALEIDHSEFGAVSIRFAQSSDGQLSAELTSADPELQRAVTAAVAADRAPNTASDSDGGRNTQAGSHRGSSAGDATQSERGQSGSDRDLPQRRGPSRQTTNQAATEQRPGVFA